MGNNMCVNEQNPGLTLVRQVKKKSQRDTTIENYENENHGINNSEGHQKEIIKTENSFQKQNEIGEYFCGGSVQEKYANSYLQRIEVFEGIMEKSSKQKQKKIKQQNKAQFSNKINQDMKKIFSEKFNFLPEFIEVNPRDLQKSIKKGAPIKYRWVSWRSHLSNISGYSLQESQKLYNSMKMESKEEDQIERDINRTFPSQPYFATKNVVNNQRDNETINGYLPLKKVLVCISNIYPQLGYCQGMNFIIGFILMINGANEEEAFWMFKILAEHPDFMLMGLYENELPLLKFLEYVAKKVIQKHCKEIMDYFESLQIPDSFWLTKWILTLFLYNFPVKICSRFWDYLIANDIFSIIKLMIPLLEVFKSGILQLNDACEVMQFFKEVIEDECKLTDPNSQIYLNITQIVKKADSYKIKKKSIAKYANQYLTQCEPNNEYAKLYSYYNNSHQFMNYHQKLLNNKVKLPSVIEENDQNNDLRLISKEDSNQYIQFKQDNCVIINKDSNQNDQNETTTNQISDIKLNGGISHVEDEKQIDDIQTIIGLEQKDIIMKRKKSNKKQHHYIQEERKQDVSKQQTTGNNSNMKKFRLFEENPENMYEKNIPQINQNEDDIEEQDQFNENNDFNQAEKEQFKQLTNSNYKKRNFRKSKTTKQEHEDTIVLDNESYIYFQSWIQQKSMGTSLNRKSQTGLNKNIDETEDDQQDDDNDLTQNKQKIFQNKLNHTTSLLNISQYEKQKNDNKEMIYMNQNRKHVGLCDSSIQEDNKHEINAYKMI